MYRTFPIWLMFWVAAHQSLQAQNLSLESARVSAGGGASSGGSFSLIGTLGQSDSGPSLSGAGFGLEGGFLATGARAVIAGSPGRPLLHIARVQDHLVISWIPAKEDYLIETTSNLTPPAVWKALGTTAVLAGGKLTVTVPVQRELQFFRLRQVVPLPALQFGRQGDKLVLSWRVTVDPVVLESNSVLGKPGSWTFVNRPVVINKGEASVVLPVSSEQQFFRLRRDLLGGTK